MGKLEEKLLFNARMKAYLAKANYLNEVEAAIYLNKGPATLKKLRCEGGGPKFVKDGGTILYARKTLDRYLDSQEASNTAEAKELLAERLHSIG